MRRQVAVGDFILPIFWEKILQKVANVKCQIMLPRKQAPTTGDWRKVQAAK